MPKRKKSVRFSDQGDIDHVPSDRELLRISAQRRPGDQTMSGGLADDLGPPGSKVKRSRNAYDDIGPQRDDEEEDEEFRKSHPPGQHTLESDEEQEEPDDRLDMENVEGQEERTIDFDDQTKITPFNMTEEMEEGHYDSTGHFVFDKKKRSEIKDAWLDEIDWTNVKRDAGSHWTGQNSAAADEEENSPPDGDTVDDPELSLSEKIDNYRSILTYMKPKESVTCTLKRLGGDRSVQTMRQERWRLKKELQQNAEKSIDNDKQKKSIIFIDRSADDVAQFTELIDNLVARGEFEAYGYTYEKLRYEIDRYDEEQQQQRSANRIEDDENRSANQVEASSSTKSRDREEGGGDKKEDDDPELDMFAENIDQDRLVSKKDEAKKLPAEADSAHAGTGQSESSYNAIMWQYKWTNDDEAEVFGPFTSEQMQKWTDDRFFKDGGVFVRRIDQPDAKFYSSKRIDFDLYT